MEAREQTGEWRRVRVWFGEDVIAEEVKDDPAWVGSVRGLDEESVSRRSGDQRAPFRRAGTAMISTSPTNHSANQPLACLRVFEMLRHHDVTGVSDAGVVADDVEFDTIDAVIAVHGHGGATEIRWSRLCPLTRASQKATQAARILTGRHQLPLTCKLNGPPSGLPGTRLQP